ncbi:UNVERIFIED_CONTAM: hypothetical protein BEN50_16770, partial [Euhalothece sp. KZN 001]
MDLPNLKDLQETTHVNDLTFEQAKELQTILKRLGYYRSNVDGIVGNLTRNALSEFKQDEWLQYPHLIGQSTIERLLEVCKEQPLRPLPSNTKEGVIKGIIEEADRQELHLNFQKAYLLATVEWETNYTFQPVKEAYWLSEAWRKRNLRYYPFYGRGFVQLTWEFNYRRYARILNLPLVKNPDLVMRPDIGVFILVHGSKNGIFTGAKLQDYLNSAKTDYYNARRFINGLD